MDGALLAGRVVAGVTGGATGEGIDGVEATLAGLEFELGEDEEVAGGT